MDVACRAFHQESFDEDVNMDDASIDGEEGVSPREVHTNIVVFYYYLKYILRLYFDFRVLY